ncbi:MAG: Mur ligase family protein, partial [Acidimicrobiia bacterium]
MIWALAVVSALAAVPAGLRWLRIAQREHYLPSSTSRFAWRWWTTGPTNYVLALLGVVGVLGSLWSVWFGFLVAAAQVGPIGLSVTGVTSPLAWTDRMKRLTMVTSALVVLFCVLGVVADVPLFVALALLSLPVLVDIGLAILAPVERSIASKWVAKARAKLESVGPDVVAITGSYGKTTTKNYVEHLLTGSRRTVASPASFNNRMGLARAINEGLTAGTEVFIAEMGTYGPGEIAELCEWITPKIAAMVAVGPVHLERFGTLERIVRAKAEILEHAEVGVINIGDPLLAPLAESKIESMQIIEVEAWHGRLKVDGSDLGAVPDGAFGSNLAVAAGICLSLGVDRDVVL